MCLNPIRIKNRSRHYSADGMQRRWLMVPCGKCAECLAMKRRQWYMRNYWHCKECYDDGGFVLFDTLTHDDAHLPYIGDFLPYIAEKAYEAAMAYMPKDGMSKEDIDKMRRLIYEEINFPCFNKQDLDSFMNLLRTRLERMGYDVRRNLDYFYSTEYGSDDEYIDDIGRHRKATFRPHYHFLFYCRVPGLTPDVLALAIYDAWHRGRTDCCNERDGLRRGYMYLHNVFGKGYTRNDDLSLRKVSNYVAKYVTKEPEYKKKVDERISAVTNAILNKEGYVMNEIAGMISGDYVSFSEYEEDFRKNVESNVGMFHNQSHGFGAYALKFPQNVIDIFYDGVVRMPDEQQVVASVPVPLYYVRKLYCRLHESMDGHYSWMWTHKGKDYLRRRAERSVGFAAKKYNDAFLNMPCDEQFFVLRMLGDGSHGNYLQDLEYWQSRFRALAEYELFFKDRFAPVNAPVTMATAVEGSTRYLKCGVFYPFIQDEDGDLWKLREFEEYDNGKVSRRMEYEFVPPEQESRYLISDFNFDIVLDCFSRHFEPLNREKQETFDKIESLRKKFRK